MRGLVHLEEYLENLEIPVDVDKKEKHTTLFLCGGENCVGKQRFLFLCIVYNASGTRSPVGKKGGGEHVLVPGFLEKKKVPLLCPCLRLRAASLCVQSPGSPEPWGKNNKKHAQ